MRANCIELHHSQNHNYGQLDGVKQIIEWKIDS